MLMITGGRTHPMFPLHFHASQSSVLRLRKFVYSFLILLIVILLLSYLTWILAIPFQALLAKAGVSLVGRALSFFLIKMGCSGGLALAIGVSARALFASEAPVALLHFMNPDGSSAAASSTSWMGNRDIVRARLKFLKYRKRSLRARR